MLAKRRISFNQPSTAAAAAENTNNLLYPNKLDKAPTMFISLVSSSISCKMHPFNALKGKITAIRIQVLFRQLRPEFMVQH